jgi:sterol desaturase/sphingolipid hydroxylase (fatty acid hydroxylase superfamily)
MVQGSREAEFAGRRKKRNNALVAIASGALPGIALGFLWKTSALHWLAGFLIGIVWANAFEYFYHRYLLHRTGSAFSRGHRQHHAMVGEPNEAEHVTLGRSPWHLSLLFASNGLLIISADLIFKLDLTPGILCGWSLYLIAAEEVHWRIHMNGWLPPGLASARDYHMSHHDIPNRRYNVFLPIFDLLLGDFKLPRKPSAAPLSHDFPS